jgi:hypothetical protein
LTPPELGRANTTSKDGPPALITIASLKSPSGDIPEHSPRRDVLFRDEVASGDVELPMAKSVNALAVLATALVALVVVSGCGAGPQAAKAPFAPGGANFSQLENRDDVTLDGVEVREVVASA